MFVAIILLFIWLSMGKQIKLFVPAECCHQPLESLGRNNWQNTLLRATASNSETLPDPGGSITRPEQLLLRYTKPEDSTAKEQACVRRRMYV